MKEKIKKIIKLLFPTKNDLLIRRWERLIGSPLTEKEREILTKKPEIDWEKLRKVTKEEREKAFKKLMEDFGKNKK